MPLQSTSGAASYDAFGGGVAAVPKYIEEYFSTFLYSGTGAAQTITNGIDLSTKGGLVWLKARNDTRNNWLYDTVRGKEYGLRSDLNFAENYSTNSITAFNNNGFSIGDSGNINTSGNNLVSWSIAKAPKFFDVVTFTGTQNSSGTGQVVSHNLGSTPGCVIIKPITDTSGTGFSIADWIVWHRSLPSNSVFLKLNSSASQNGNSDKIQAVSSTTFTAGWEVGYTGQQYVAYLFAHNAGGFGLTGTDNVISCGSFTTNGSGNATVDLGYEPQWVLVKGTGSGYGWSIFDNMRGMPVTGNSMELLANSSSAEGGIGSSYFNPTATGFYMGGFSASQTYIYIAIRRGPMKVPTSGTSVFSPITATSGTQTTGFPVDMQILSYRSGTDAFLNHQVIDRLRGVSSTSTPQGNYLNTTSTAAESNVDPFSSILMSNTGFQVGNNYAGASSVFQSFRRAPSFFDEVCYTVSGFAANNVAHNLTVTPELFITKPRGSTGGWIVYGSILGATTKYMTLYDTQALQTSGSTVWGATSSTFSEPSTAKNGTYVCYLFATCAGVSKVFSYTGNGSSQTINCGFTAGARWILIKRTDSTGDWYVWDSARGIVAGNDSHLSLNSTAAEVTTDDSVDTDNTGFIVNQVAATNVNVTSATYIGIAIA